MKRIVVDTGRMDQRVPELQRIAGDLQRVSERVSTVSSRLRWNTSVTPVMRTRISQQQMGVDQLQKKMGSLSAVLSEISAEYQKAEGENQKNTTPSKENDRDTAESAISFSSKDKNRVIQKFEDDYPEYAKLLNDFLSGGNNNKLNADDIREIKYLAYTAREPFRSAFFKSLSKFSIGDGDMDGGAYYSPANRTVNYTYDNIWERMRGFLFGGGGDSFGNDPRGRFTTLFHECGHAIDDVSDITNTAGFDTDNFTVHSDAIGRDITLREAILYDVYHSKTNPHSVMSIANDIINSGKSGCKGNIDNVIKAFQTGDTNSLSNNDLALYNAVKNKHLGSTKANAQYEAVSDVYGGVSRNALRNGYGHDTNYWNNETMAGKELWAEYFSYEMAGDSQNMSYLKEFFPEASKVLEGYANSFEG